VPEVFGHPIEVLFKDRGLQMSRKHGFTLIELLVVISIIALLMAIMMPALGRAREIAKKMVCMSNTRTMGLGVMMYVQESDNWSLPMINDSNQIWFRNRLYAAIVGMKGRRNSVADQVANALTLPDEFMCPSDPRKPNKGMLETSPGTILGTSYGLNGTGMWPPSGRGWNYHHYNGLGKFTRVIKPQDKFMFMDSTDWAVHMDSANYKAYWDVYGNIVTSQRWHTPAYRHDEGLNMVYYDGHVEYLPKEKVYIFARNAILTRLENQKHWYPIPDRATQQITDPWFD
jgi:prepilin-type N-terminal cleavage/methylation domain-containing protein/prepilin-type processing-associated H-X9-DG protein